MTHPELKPFQAIILVLSIVAVGALAVELVFTVPAEAQRVMRWIDNIICVVLLIDFSIRFYRAESKLEFMKWGWIELLASIPEVEALRWGRAFRVFRILRLLRAVRSLRLIFEILFRSRTRSGLASVFMITFLMLSVSSVGILLSESAPDSNIHTANASAANVSRYSEKAHGRSRSSPRANARTATTTTVTRSTIRHARGAGVHRARNQTAIQTLR